jgi:hypothetical protein
VGVVDEGVAAEGVVEAPVPKRLVGALDPGGGPAGVVELFPNKEPLAGAGVEEAAFPNMLFPPAALPPPNSPLVEV